MEKKKNSKIKEYWNEKGKSLCFKVLHILSYVLSLGFIILCVYACANTNNKDNKDNNVKKGLYLEHPKQIIYQVNPNNPSSNYKWQYLDDFNNLVHVIYDCLVDNDYNPQSIEGSHLFILNGQVRAEYDGFVEPTINFRYLDNNQIYYSVSANPFVSNFNFSSVQYENIVAPLLDYIFVYNADFDNMFEIEEEVYFHLTNSIAYNYVFGFDNENLFNGVTNSLTDYIDTIGQGLESSVEIFYDENNSQLTAIGWLSVIVVAVGLSWSIFSIVSGLIRLRG